MSALAASIEAFLLAQGGWIDSDALCLVFHVEPRELRATGDMPGLCSCFAISGPRGFRHIYNATDEEWLHFHAKMRSHGINELRRVKALRLARAARNLKTQLEMAL